jgi:competence protein ComEC
MLLGMTRRHGVWGILILLLTVCVLAVVVLVRPQEPVLTVSFLNVGQGDAIFIESPTGAQLLIDGGKGAGVLRELGSVMGFFDKSIDVVLATHPDMDHIGGLPDVFARYDVGQVLISGVADSGADNAAFLQAVAREGLVPHHARAGEVLSLGGGVFVQVLFPVRDMGEGDVNAASVVVRVVYGETVFLLTGDAPASIEAYLAGVYGSNMRADVLKLGHHGSKTSSSDVFLDVVAPEHAIVSAGCDNSYGHPHDEVVRRVAERGIMLHETCEGRVRFVSDGKLVY